MLKPLDEALAATPLPDLGAIRVQGADALKFLQGQLSNDTQQLSATRSQLSGLHSAQGRVIALLRLVLVAPDDVLAVLPRELAELVAMRLGKYVLRAKAKVTDASADWRFYGITEEPATGALPQELDAQARQGSSFILRYGLGRWLLVSPASEAPPARLLSNRDRWDALGIASGFPEVYSVTSEAFVAQMLNLDVIGAIAFDKGCYTGQEIIARAHYRGRVKRRMHRFRTRTPLAQGGVGQLLKLNDGRSARVVQFVPLLDGRVEFLAVTNISPGDDAAPGPEGSDTAPQSAVEVEELPLPYALPD